MTFKKKVSLVICSWKKMKKKILATYLTNWQGRTTSIYVLTLPHAVLPTAKKLMRRNSQISVIVWRFSYYRMKNTIAKLRTLTICSPNVCPELYYVIRNLVRATKKPVKMPAKAFLLSHFRKLSSRPKKKEKKNLHFSSKLKQSECSVVVFSN